MFIIVHFPLSLSLSHSLFRLCLLLKLLAIYVALECVCVHYSSCVYRPFNCAVSISSFCCGSERTATANVYIYNLDKERTHRPAKQNFNTDLYVIRNEKKIMSNVCTIDAIKGVPPRGAEYTRLRVRSYGEIFPNSLLLLHCKSTPRQNRPQPKRVCLAPS